MIAGTEPATRGAAFARGQSRQDYETPTDFIEAVVKLFGKLEWDLAATAENKKAPQHFGPGSPWNENSLAMRWQFADTDYRPTSPLCWLNPPFADIAPWAKACAFEQFHNPRFRGLLLTPASVGSRWFEAFVFKKARVLFLGGTNYRLKFVGAKDPYPKDCMLSCFGYPPGFEVWDWRGQE